MKFDSDKSVKIYDSNSFYDDRLEDFFLSAVLVRSPVPDGTIRSIEHACLPEGYSLFTAKDIPGENAVHTFEAEFPVFASEKISYEGEPVGILVGPDYGVLLRLLSELNITYTRASTDEKEKEISASRQYGFGNFERAWKNAKIKADKTYCLNLRLPSCGETDGAFCRVQGKTLSLYTPTCWTSHLYRNLSSALNLDKSHIQLYKTNVPFSHKNSPWHNTALSVQCAIAALLSKQNVLLRLSRSEQLLYIEKPLPVKIRHKTAIDSEGVITAASMRIEIDAGAFNPFIAPLVDRLAVSCTNMYKIQNLSVEALAYRSHTSSGAPSLSWADYHGFYAMESQIQELARLANLNSVDVRLRNINAGKDLQKDFPLRFETTPACNVINDVVQKSDFYRKHAAYKLNTYKAESLFSSVPVRGIGFACAYEGSGFLGTEIDSLKQSLEVSMEKDGSAVIYANAPSATVSSIWKNIAAELLSIPVKSVTIDASPRTEESELPETMVSNISVMTQLVKKCCIAIQKLRFRQPLPIRVKRSFVPGKKNVWDNESFGGTPFYTASWAAAAAEIELNPKTYTYGVRTVWISIDGGTILYDSKAEQVVNRCVKALFSCSEEFQTNPVPAVFVNFVPGGTEPKQIGELVFDVLPAAICSAVSQALQKRLTDFPINPNTIYDAVKETEKEEDRAHTAENQS